MTEQIAFMMGHRYVFVASKHVQNDPYWDPSGQQIRYREVVYDHVNRVMSDKPTAKPVSE